MHTVRRSKHVWTVVEGTCLVIPVIVFLWLCLDGYLDRVPNDWAIADTNLHKRLVAIRLLDFVFWAAWGVAFLGAMFGDRRQRSLRFLFRLMLSVGMWSAIHIQFHQIANFGRVTRHQFNLSQFRKYAADIDRRWGTIASGDGAAFIGPFQAYPTDEPSVLMFPTDMTIPGTNETFCAVERTSDHVVRFELTRSNGGYWLEVRADNKLPSEFVGGLEERYRLIDVVPVGERVFLVRYASSSPWF